MPSPSINKHIKVFALNNRNWMNEFGSIPSAEKFSWTVWIIFIFRKFGCWFSWLEFSIALSSISSPYSKISIYITLTLINNWVFTNTWIWQIFEKHSLSINLVYVLHAIVWRTINPGFELKFRIFSITSCYCLLSLNLNSCCFSLGMVTAHFWFYWGQVNSQHDSHAIWFLQMHY